MNDEGIAERAGDADSLSGYRPLSGGSPPKTPSVKTRSSFFKTFRRQNGSVPKAQVRAETSMEGELIDKIGKLDFSTQVEAFYTAYSKVYTLEHFHCVKACLEGV